MKKFVQSLYYTVGVIFILVVVPVMVITLIRGNKVNYVETAKYQVIAPSFLLTIIAVIILASFVFLLGKDKEIALTKKSNMLYNLFLIAFFAVIALVNIELSREMAFRSSYDMSTVRDTAFYIHSGAAFGSNVYFSMYPNNIPISYLLAQILKVVDHLPNYPFDADFIWVQISCVLFSIAGFFSCQLLKRLSKSFLLQLMNIALFLWLVGLSGWKMIAYTDSYGIIFAPIAIYTYMVYRDGDKTWVKLLNLFISLVSVAVGGWLKPSIYVLFIAIIGIELLEMVSDIKRRYPFVLFALIVLAVSLPITKQYNKHIENVMQLESNPELATTWHHYFSMGLGEKKTGGYDSDYAKLYVEYQDSQKDRINAEMKIAKDLIIQRGFSGNVVFAVRKMVKVFDDGGFSFTTPFIQVEWIESQYEKISRNTKFTEFLREIYWNGKYMGAFNTLTQTVWFVCLLGIPGIGIVCFRKKEWNLLILPVAFLGVYFYQMFFEARSRYLFVFLPFIIPAAVYGMKMYFEIIKSLMTKRKDEA